MRMSTGLRIISVIRPLVDIQWDMGEMFTGRVALKILEKGLQLFISTQENN